MTHAETAMGDPAARTLFSYDQEQEGRVGGVARVRRVNDVGELRTSLLPPHRRPGRHLLTA